MKVRETIHHGDYYNVREQDIEPTFAGISELLLSSPYGMGKTLIDHAGNKYVLKMAADLLKVGSGEHGWARYEVIEK